ncbi:hypothetical protein BGW38_005173 [Lunasporangiospora selenospora]|uniref:Ig-like domain-containing protein n=1 Tax=Lunasporangiospora selenospora TaxID=979761 RepID=A0A9P6KHD4_9FUNG|nr:hypothetical protein BGW38_005173 [Lunasporangiospora selenospora]
MPPPAPLKASASRPQRALHNPRIPLEYCDGPTQRLYAVSTFVFLQAVKLYYWIGIAKSDYAAEFFGFILWLSVDVLFLLALNYLQIPWLELPTVRLIVALFILTVVNFVLFTAREISPVLIAQSTLSKVLGYVRTPSLHREPHFDPDHDEHLLGKHTILKRPFSSAVLNPRDQCFCIPDPDFVKMPSPLIPILFNGSEPHYLEYSVTSFETGLTTEHKVADPSKNSASVLRKLPDLWEDGRPVYGLQADVVGAYKLRQLKDSDGVDIKFFREKEVYVVQCPEARVDRYKETLDHCSGKGDVDIPIVARGLPPWSVTYRRSSNTGKEIQDLLIQSEPPGYSSPFLIGWSQPTKPNYSWARLHEMNLSASLSLANPGEYDFQVIKVKDGCNNVLDFTELVAKGHREPEILHVNIRSPPTVSMVCDPRKPIKIVSLNETSSTDISLDIKHGTTPYRVGYVYQKSDIDEPEIMQDIEISRKEEARIIADRPGLYTLSHIQDQYCKGDIVLPMDCSVTVASLPTVEISTTTIEDQCVGAIGVSIAATFTGEAPWKVCYDVWSNDRLQKENVCQSSSKPRLTLKMTPSESGTFRYQFRTVSDINYKLVKLDLPPVLQKIHPQPSASFTEGTTGIKACRGSTKKLGVQLGGEGPWDIKYQVIHQGRRQVFSSRDIKESKTELTVPAFEHEGTYSVDLESVTDRSNGCTKALSVSDVTIEVSSGPPTVSFQCDAPIEFAEDGHVDLPIHLTGGSPWHMTYGIEGEDSLSAARSESRNALVTIYRPGTYILKSVSDAFCEGEVVEQASKCQVVISERPAMNLKVDSIRFRGGPRGDHPEDEVAPLERLAWEKDHFVMPAVCQDAPRSLEIRLTGKAPFVLKYKTIFKSDKGGRDEEKSHTLESLHSTMRLPVLTDRTGVVTYRLETLSDAIYSDVKLLHDTFDVVFKHLIRTAPVATIQNNKKQEFCKNDVAGLAEKIPIKIQNGIGPFSLTIEVQQPNQPVEIIPVYDATTNNHGIYNWPLPSRLTGVGLHMVTVTMVTDLNGCSSGKAGKDSSIEFEILDTPSITPISDAVNACVGDNIAFSLQGATQPFEVSYSLDKSQEKIVLDAKTRSFTYHATKPGILKISQVCQTIHNRKKCCTRPEQELTARIWALPRGLIDDGNEDKISNLLEGDRVGVEITLEGEPPFSFVYVRKEAEFDVNRHHKDQRKFKILQTEYVPNIHDKQYTVYTAMEGRLATSREIKSKDDTNAMLLIMNI